MMKIRRIVFDPKSHTYTDSEDQSIYTAVSTKVEQVVPKFNKDYWAAVKARQRGVPVSVILAEWKQINETSIVRGNGIHEELEDGVVSSGATFFNSSDKDYICNGAPHNPVWGYEVSIDLLSQTHMANKYPKIYDFIVGKIKDGWKLCAEKRVYSYEYHVAGTIDLLLVKGTDFIILDWKTNKDGIKFKAGYYKKENGIKTNIWVDKKEYLLRPVSMLPNCKGNIYSLQLSLYALLCEMWGFKCREIWLFHIDLLGEVTRFPITYYKREAMSLCKYAPNLRKLNAKGKIAGGVPDFNLEIR